MASINVLSDIPKRGNKLEKTPTLKGNDVADSSQNAAAAFAAMLSGSMNLSADPKGQDSSIAGQESEKKQSTDNPVPSVQNPNGLESRLGYGNLGFSLITQPMLQSNLPAGKEANSGDFVNPRTGEVLPTDAQGIKAQVVPSNNNPSLIISSQVSPFTDQVCTATGMEPSKLQGNNPEITELDKYRGVIAELLEELSGKISSLQGNPLSSNTGITNLSEDTQDTQDTMKLDQTLMDSDPGGQSTKIVERVKSLQLESAASANSPISKVMDILEVFSETIQALSAKGNSLSPQSAGIKDLSSDILKIAHFLLSDNSISSENNGTTEIGEVIAKIAQDLKTYTSDEARKEVLPGAQIGYKPLLDALSQRVEEMKTTQRLNKVEADFVPADKGSSESITKQLKGSSVTPDETQGKETASPKDVRRSESVEPDFGHDGKNQNPSVAIGVVSNAIATNTADGKIAALPVWEQILTAFREQVLTKHQDLKELDIQLHPAELGKIQIGMRWENGQVHLQVQASEAATGQLLQNQLLDLRHALTSQGVNCGMLQMGLGGDRQHNPQGDESQRMFKQSSEHDENEELVPVDSTLSYGQDEINRINVTA